MGTKTLKMFRAVICTVLAVFVLAGGTLVQAQSRRPQDNRTQDSRAQDSRAAENGVTRMEGEPANAYAIGVGDVLEISVWKNNDLNATVPVRPDGRISVPLLGDVQAAGLTPLALRQMLTEGYKEYVTAPGVSVVVKEINSQKVFVTGEVAHPGSFDLRPRTKVMQVLALAGGLTAYAKGRVILLRDARDGQGDRRFEIRLDAIVSGKRPGDNLVLQPGDTLVVP
jgi:polysaccharide export outer membrane protein